MSIKLISERLQLRPLRADEAAIFFSLLETNKPRLIGNFPKLMSWCTSEELTQSFIQKQEEFLALRKKVSLGIFDLSNDKMIGFIFLKDVEFKPNQAQVGYFISEVETGKGYITEALQRVCTFAFEQFKLDQLIIRVQPENIASKCVAEKAGFIYTETKVKDFENIHKQWMDIEYYIRKF